MHRHAHARISSVVVHELPHASTLPRHGRSLRGGIATSVAGKTALRPIGILIRRINRADKLCPVSIMLHSPATTSCATTLLAPPAATAAIARQNARHQELVDLMGPALERRALA